MLEQITQALTDAVLPSITLTSPLLGLVLVVVAQFVKMKIKNENALWALDRISQTVLTVVTNHMQTTMKNGGDIEKAVVKNTAVQDIMGQIPEPVIKAASKGVTDITKFIDQKIEKTVFDLKQKIKDTVAS
jgi:hypothetical protein